MQLRELSSWTRIRESMWFVPAVLVLGGLALSLATVELDRQLGAEIDAWFPFVYDGGTEGARVILGTIAGAMATVVGIAFSITIVVLQLAAGQYSPRVITTFRTDRGQQVVLGTYVATFVYSLLAVRQVEDPFEGGEPFIPGLSMLTALVLAVVCLGMLVYFVHHTSEQLRVADIARRIHADLVELGDTLYPDHVGEPHGSERDDAALIEELEASTRPSMLVRCERAGYVRHVETDKLEALATPPVEAIRVCPCIGEFVVQGGPLMELYLEAEVPDPKREALEARARHCFSIGSHPTVAQSPDLGIRQLVDIALRALSPGVHDPTTAEQVLAQLGDWIGRLAHKSFPRTVREVDGRMIVVPRPSYPDHVAEAFDQIRRVAGSQIHVLHSLLDVFDRIVETDPPDDRLSPLRHQVEAIARLASEENVSDPQERRALADHARWMLDKLPTG